VDSNAAAIVRICRLCEGTPLALELAASWIKSLSCAEIAEELATGLTILSTRLRNIPERHRTMRVVFEESWRRLSEQEQSVFLQLSIFRGGFRRDAAQQVASASLPVLSTLVDCSLLKQNVDGRYQIHELLRQFGEERLAEAPLLERATQEAHGTYFMAFLAERHFAFDGHGQFQAVQEISDELENIRHAWQWAVKHLRVEAIHKALRSLFFFCQQRSRYLEGAETLADTARHLERGDLTGERGAALAECLTYYGWLCIRLSRLAEANVALTRARHLYDTLAISPPQYRAGDPITAMLILALVQGDYDQALTLGEQARQQAEQHNQPAALAFAYSGLSSTLLAQGKFAQAWSYAEQSLALNDSIGNRWLSCYCHDILGQIAYVQEKLHVAKHHFKAAYAIREESGEPGGMAETLNHLGEVALAENEPEVAQQHYERSLMLSREVNNRGACATATKGLGDVAYSQGQHLLAENYYQQALLIALDSHYTPLIFKLLLASANLFLQTDRRLLGIDLFAFVYHHPASDFICKEQAHQALEHLGVYPVPALQEFTLQVASPQWAALLRAA
jgi:tetratricopeptide (TPR) repeat protein